MLRDSMGESIPLLGSPAAQNDQIRIDDGGHVFNVSPDFVSPGLPVEPSVLPALRREPEFGGADTFKFDLAQLEIGNKTTLDDQTATNTSAEGEHKKLAPNSSSRPEPDLCHGGSISIVDHHHTAAEFVGQEVMDIDAYPTVVDVVGRRYQSVNHYGRKPDSNRTV